MSKISEFRLSNTILYDPSKCTGCKVCELVCSYNHDGVFSPSKARIYIFNDLFSGENFSDYCRQCAIPQCYTSCIIGAIYIDEKTGGIILDETKCNSCGECAKACPYNKTGKVIKYNETTKKFYKCDLCGGSPACVEWCAPNALTYVTRGEKQ